MRSASLRKDAPQELDRNDERRRAGSEGDECGEEAKANVHPVAWSTKRTLNGVPPAGVTVNDRPQWPTMTSAGAAAL